MSATMRAPAAGLPMDWPSLLSPRRVGAPGAAADGPSRTAFQQDFDRIVFSAAFRRMQDKTQIFPLSENDYVRTRLTHSMEVACVARSLGTMTGEIIRRRHGLDALAPQDVGAILAAAGLAHDIGNPPFGHAGEAAICHWYAESPVAARFRDRFSAVGNADFENFEGNANGFRILVHRQNPSIGGLQLTAAVLGAFTKYPNGSLVPGPGVPEKRTLAGTRKFGFFEADRDAFVGAAADLGLAVRHPGLAWHRHPLAFLLEAADDACYNVVDFEDGYLMGCLEYGLLEELLLALCAEPVPLKRRLDGILDRKDRVSLLRAQAIDFMIRSTVEAFAKNEAAILDGSYEGELLDDSPCAAALRTVREVAREKIFVAAPAMYVENAGYEVIYGLLELFASAAWERVEGRQHPTQRFRSLWELLPASFKPPGADPYPWLLSITDYVSGMSDSYAISLYRRLKGIVLPRG